MPGPDHGQQAFSRGVNIVEVRRPAVRDVVDVVQGFDDAAWRVAHCSISWCWVEDIAVSPLLLRRRPAAEAFAQAYPLARGAANGGAVIAVPR